MLISAIITTRNEEKHIGNCLKALKNQTYHAELIQIIVVDNGSTDRTKEIARQYTDQVYDKGPERSVQRNYGVSISEGDYFIYLDADMILHENVIDECVNRIRSSPDTIGLYISEIVMGDNFFSRVRRFERTFYDATVIDCARFIKKESFLAAGGFDETLTGPEDWDLDKKLRAVGKINLLTTPVYHNEAEFSLKTYLTKKGYYSGYMDDYIAKWGKDDIDLKKQFSIYYRFFGVFVENGKWKRLLAHPGLTSGMYFLRFLVGFKFLTRAKQ